MSLLEQIAASNFEDTFTYEDFKATMLDYGKNGKTSGPDQSDSMVHYTKLNASRLRRLDKTSVLTDALKRNLDEISGPLTFLGITETWCGDAIQTLPYIQKMVEYNPMIDFKLMWRDEGPNLISDFLTNGGRSIPKIIVLDSNYKLLFDWGPRPEPAQKLVTAWRNADEPKPPYLEFSETLQRWYLKDQGQVFQKEFGRLLSLVPSV